MGNFWKNYRFLIVSFIIWKITLFVFGFFFSQTPHYQPTFPYWENLADLYKFRWIYAWGGFDGVHYLNIAQNGYSNQFTQAFFPLYPILIYLFSLFGSIPQLYIGVLLNNIGFFLSLVLLKKIFHDIFKSYGSNVYRKAVLLYLIFPTSFFFNSVYNEGIFLLLSLWCFYLFSKQKFFYAGVVGTISGFVRIIGVFMLPALLIEIVFNKLVRKKKYPLNILFVLLIPTGLLIYMGFLHFKYNDMFLFLHAQNYFGNSRSSELVLLPQVVFRYLKILFTVPISYTYLISVLELFVTAVFMVIPIIFYKKIPIYLMVYSILIVVIPALTGTLSSMPRYVLMAFPVFWIMTDLKNKYYYPVAVLLIMLQIILLFNFFKGNFVA